MRKKCRECKGGGKLTIHSPECFRTIRFMECSCPVVTCFMCKGSGERNRHSSKSY